MNSNLDFYIRRIHSITGIVPIGFFLLEHIVSISTVLGGPKMFDSTVAHLASVPHEVLIPLEIFAIAIPFLFHAIYGVIILLNANNNTSNYGYARNWQFYMQRITAIYVGLFLIWHVVVLRFMVKGAGLPINYDQMHAYLSSPIVFILYLIGLIAAIFHFTNGIFTFLITWGITVGPRAQAFASNAMMGLFVLLSALGTAALFKFFG